MRLPGQYFDTETGLHYNYYRDYEPGTGRYIESDPIGLGGGINTYAYTNSNPLDSIDSRGTISFGPSCDYTQRVNLLIALFDMTTELLTAVATSSRPRTP